MEEKKKKKGRGCLPAIVGFVVLGVIISALGGGGNNSTGSEPQDSGGEGGYSTEFNPEYTTSCTDTSITIDMKYNCPDGALMQCMLLNNSLDESYSATAAIAGGEASFTFDLENTDAKVYGGMILFQFNAESVEQPDSVKAVYGEYGENLAGENTINATVAGHDDAKNGSVSFVVNYPSDEAIQEIREDAWSEYVNNIISESDGTIVQIDRASDNVYSIYFTNSWYLLTSEQKEYVANTMWDGTKSAAKNIFSEDVITLNIYAGNTLVAESSVWTDGMKIK